MSVTYVTNVDETNADVAINSLVVEYYTDTKVKLVEGSYDNIKITTPEDIAVAEAIIDRKSR